MTDLLSLRITRVQPEIATSTRVEASSYYLEPVDGRPVLYQAGQFLTLILSRGTNGSNSHEVRRSYSLSSAPAVDDSLRLTIKRVFNGEISRYLLDTLRVGDVLTSLPPAGRFTLDDAQTGDVVLIGAGSGITPLFSILKHVLHTQPNQHVTLLYSNTNEQSILFREELSDLHRHHSVRFRLIHLLSNPTDDSTGLRENIRRGRLNNVTLERLLPELVGNSKPDTIGFFVCGPGDYMRMVQFTLVFSGIRPNQIRRENFVIDPVVLTPPPADAIDRTVLLHFRDREVEITVPAYKSILQATLDQGIALPYSCRGGRCSTCTARCTAGRVVMTINDVLTERDLADGWILTCTGFPASDGVVLNL